MSGALTGLLGHSFGRRSEKPIVTCRHCGTDGRWEMTKDGWRIHVVGPTGGLFPHKCSQFAASERK